jgi:double-stranded uracil-DNA glycosylase
VTETPRIVSFPAIATAEARILILGSMPGAASLEANEYYAHPRNAFWPIMAAVFGFDPAVPYRERVAALMAARIAVWDVLKACRRSGSLDSDIEPDSIEVNDFAALFEAHPDITRVCFNGGTAERYFQRFVPAILTRPDLHYTRLPSTSPAHAAMSLADKAEAWRSALTHS